MSTNEPKKTSTMATGVPDPEVVPQAKRRKFSAAYKKRILEEVDRCSQPGEIGALLRREGLYSSHLSKWRQQRARGQAQGLAPRKRGRKAVTKSELEIELHQLRQEQVRLQARLEQAEAIIEVQKKLSQLLGLIPSEPDGRK
jgi:transposase-like protein